MGWHQFSLNAKAFLIFGIFLSAPCPQCSSLVPIELAQTLLRAPVHPFLDVIFTGDPQYHYPCTDQNGPCKQRSRNCTMAREQRQQTAQNGTTNLVDTWLANFVDETNASGERREDCLRMESEFANEVQRKCIFQLIRQLGKESGQKPAALVINGDLTNFGHFFQLELFKAEWLRTMPVPVLVGLGNHDYENNVEDCVGNVCAERMLRWFSQEYAPSMGGLVANLDVTRREQLWKSHFEGSLAYSSRLCGTEERQQTPPPPFCVHSIQLHNRPDYAATIQYPTGQWHIRGSFQWLTAELGRILEGVEANGSRQSPRQIVLLNLHNHAAKAAERLRGTLEHWTRLNAPRGVRLDFVLLFAHIHENHSMAIRCLNGRKVPHIFVGSVPNNRFTTIRFHPGEGGQAVAQIFLLQANADSTAQIVQMVDFQWANC